MISSESFQKGECSPGGWCHKPYEDDTRRHTKAVLDALALFQGACMMACMHPETRRARKGNLIEYSREYAVLVSSSSYEEDRRTNSWRAVAETLHSGHIFQHFALNLCRFPLHKTRKRRRLFSVLISLGPHAILMELPRWSMAFTAKIMRINLPNCAGIVIAWRLRERTNRILRSRALQNYTFDLDPSKNYCAFVLPNGVWDRNYFGTWERECRWRIVRTL